MLSALFLAAALTAVQTSTAVAAPLLAPDTPISDDGRIGSQIQQLPQAGRALSTAGSTGTGNLSDAKGVRAANGPGPRVVAPDEFSTQSIIAPDQRTQVTNTTTYPARANVYFTYTKPNGSTSWCTGWMYAPNAMATAGHCVHSGGTGGAWNTNFTVYPGRNAGSSPYGSCSASNVFSVTGWTQSASVEYDYAALKLNCTVGNTTGWYGLRWTTTSFNGTAVSSAGYPQDKAAATQWFTSSTVSATYTRQLAYHLDTVGGQSGSAVYTAGCTTFCALAVHAYGYGDHNRGTRITEGAFNNFNNWKL